MDESETESELKQMPEQKLGRNFRKIDRQGFLHLLQDKGLLNSRDGAIEISGETQRIDDTYFLKKSVNEIKEQCFFTGESYGVMSGPIIFKILDMKIVKEEKLNREGEPTGVIGLNLMETLFKIHCYDINTSASTHAEAIKEYKYVLIPYFKIRPLYLLKDPTICSLFKLDSYDKLLIRKLADTYELPEDLAIKLTKILKGGKKSRKSKSKRSKKSKKSRKSKKSKKRNKFSKKSKRFKKTRKTYKSKKT